MADKPNVMAMSCYLAELFIPNNHKDRVDRNVSCFIMISYLIFGSACFINSFDEQD